LGGRGGGNHDSAPPFELVPSIDLRHGRVVRLRRGDDAERTFYDADPREVLARFAASGVARAHLVDLDAAFGEPPQRALLAELSESAARAGGPALQLGGGLRDRAAIDWALAAGFERVVLGSLVARDPAAFGALARALPGRLVPALDAAGGEVRVDGWRRGAGTPAVALAAALAGLPCPAVLVTDVERDGTLDGANVELALSVAVASGLRALVSGGVRSLADLAAMRQKAAAGAPLAGVVVGRALYDGTFTLADALAAARGEES
jgi:phosphoribosylformimino-5-aminoimidazole carboxamide ribotide isomerase